MKEEEKIPEKKILFERAVSFTVITFDNGGLTIKDFKTDIGDIELVGVLTILLNVIQKKYSFTKEIQENKT